MVRGRRRGSLGGTRRAGMVLAAVLLMVMVSPTRGRSQLSIVEDIDKSLGNILQDVQSLQRFINTSTTPRETTPGGASTSGISSEMTTESSVFTTDTTDVDSSSTDISNAPSDTTTTANYTSTTSATTTTSTADSSSSMSTAADSTTFSSSMSTVSDPTSSTATSTAADSTTSSSSMSTVSDPTSSTATSTVSTISTTMTDVPTSSTTLTTFPSTTTTTTTTDVPTTSTTTTDDPTTSTTTTAVPTTSTTTTAIPTSSTTTVSTTSTTTMITTEEPMGPESNDRVNRWNFLSLATGDDALSAWVGPRIAWLNDKMSTDTSDVTSDSTSSEYTTPTSPVTDDLRLEAALNEVDQVVAQVAAGTITEDQVRQMQAAEAEVKDVTDSPDETLVDKLQSEEGYLDGLLERIKKDQDTIAETLDGLKKHETSVIVGSVLGGILLIVLVAVGAVCCMRHKKKKNNGGRSTAKKRSQSALASAQQQMVELGSNRGSSVDEFPPHSMMPPNPLIPRANLDNFSQSSAQRNVAPESNGKPDEIRSGAHDDDEQVGEMRSEPGIDNPGYVEEFRPRPVVPPKPRKRPSTFDNFGLSPGRMRIEQEPSGAHFVPSRNSHYIDELSNRLSPRERQVRPVGENYYSPTEPRRRSSRDPSPRHHQHHQHHQHPRNHRMRHRNDHHVRRTPSVPPPDYTIPRDRNRSSDKNFIAPKPHSPKPSRSPYEFADPQRTAAPPKSEPPRPERNRSDIRRPYGPEDLY